MIMVLEVTGLTGKIIRKALALELLLSQTQTRSRTPYGTQFNVKNSNGTSAYRGTALDTGAGWDAKHHNVGPSQWIDIWLPGNQANEWGLQWRDVTICTPEGGN